MKCFTLFILFVLGCTALLPLGPGLPVPPGRNALQTVDAGLETAVSPAAGEISVDTSLRHVPIYPLSPCCPYNRYWHPTVCRYCTHTSTDLPTTTHGLTLPRFDNFTVPVPTGHYTRANNTAQALNATTSTVSTIFVSAVTPTVINRFDTKNVSENTHTICIIADGKGTGRYKCITPQHHQTKTPTPTTLATVPTVPDPSGSPPFMPHWPPRHAPCTTTLTTTPGLHLAPKIAAATTVTDTKYVDCHGCKLEIKTVDNFGHGPMVPPVFLTVPRGGLSSTATETVTKCHPMPIIN